VCASAAGISAWGCSISVCGLLAWLGEEHRGCRRGTRLLLAGGQAGRQALLCWLVVLVQLAEARQCTGCLCTHTCVATRLPALACSTSTCPSATTLPWSAGHLQCDWAPCFTAAERGGICACAAGLEAAASIAGKHSSLSLSRPGRVAQHRRAGRLVSELPPYRSCRLLSGGRVQPCAPPCRLSSPVIPNEAAVASSNGTERPALPIRLCFELAQLLRSTAGTRCDGSGLPAVLSLAICSPSRPITRAAQPRRGLGCCATERKREHLGACCRLAKPW